jgi:hypothetical protein
MKDSVVKWLNLNEFMVRDLVAIKGQGADITARKARSHHYLLVTVKGDVQPEERRQELTQALGQIIQRVRSNPHCRYAIALPIPFRELVLRHLPWPAAKQLKLQVLIVDKEGRVERLTWRELQVEQGATVSPRSPLLQG